MVCGANNVRPGLKVALAMIGATLPNGLKLKNQNYVANYHKVCCVQSQNLVWLISPEGIMELDPGAPVGMDIRDYFSLDDHVFDVDLTPNRAGSVLGIAREVAVLNKLPLLTPDILLLRL